MRVGEVRAALDRLKSAAAQGVVSMYDVREVERGIGDLLRWIRKLGPADKRYAKQIYALANKKNRIGADERKRAGEVNQKLMKMHPAKTPRYAAVAEQMDVTSDRVRYILEGRRPAKKK